MSLLPPTTLEVSRWGLLSYGDCLWLPVLLFFISLITFALGVYGPGDPVQVLLGLHANPETVERLRHEYGFDQPFYVQYLNYVANALQGNFGYSLVKYRDQPVGKLIADALPVTIQLNLVAIFLGLGIGVPLGSLGRVASAIPGSICSCAVWSSPEFPFPLFFSTRC